MKSKRKTVNWWMSMKIYLKNLMKCNRSCLSLKKNSKWKILIVILKNRKHKDHMKLKTQCLFHPHFQNNNNN